MCIAVQTELKTIKMKIRIKDNSIRLRLTKSDVAQLKSDGIVSAQTILSEKIIFRYKLSRNTDEKQIRATFSDNEIHVILSKEAARILTDTPEITVKGHQENGEDGGLFLLIEKDLACLDETHEDQSDMYENPKTEC